jgi:hypothetical protein
MTVFLGCFGGSSPLPLGRSPRGEPCTLPRRLLPAPPLPPPPPPPSSIEARHEMGSLALAGPSAAGSRCCADALDHAAASGALNAPGGQCCRLSAAGGPCHELLQHAPLGSRADRCKVHACSSDAFAEVEY